MLFLVVSVLVGSAWLAPGTDLNLSITPLIEGRDNAMDRENDLARQLPPRYAHHIVTVTWADPIGTREMRLLASLTEDLTSDPAIEEVVSVATIPVVVPGALLPRAFGKILGDRSAVEVARQHPLIYRRLISKDGRSAILPIRMAPSTGASARPDLLDWVKERISAHLGPDVKSGFMSGRIAERQRKIYMREDLFVIIALELLVALVLLPLVFRSWRGVVLPVVGMVSALLVNVGLLSSTVGTLGIIEMAIPGLVLMIALSDAIHMIHRFEEALDEGHPPREAIRHMTANVGVACFITSLTTAIGFLSLLIADHAAVREFGLKAAVAVMVAFVVTMVVIPLGLAFWRVRGPALPRLPGLHRLTYGKGKLVMVGFVLIMGLAGVGISQVEVSARWLEELPADDPVRDRLALMEDQFCGALTLEAELVGNLGSTETLRELERFQQRMLEFPEVIRAETVTHWLRAATGRQTGEIDASLITGGRRRLAAIGRGHTRHIVRADYKLGRAIFNVYNLGSRRLLKVRDEMERIGRELAPSLKIEPMGYGLLAYESAQNVSQTLLQSLALSLVAITLLLCLVYRSITLGLISIIPNVVPIAFALGLTGWLDIPLRIGIVMIYSIGLGLAVDDTVHLLTRLQQERRLHPQASMRESILRSLRSAGAAMAVTSVILIAGALCFLPANFQSVHDTGILLTAIIGSAVLADLFVLPLLLERLLRR